MWRLKPKSLKKEKNEADSSGKKEKGHALPYRAGLPKPLNNEIKSIGLQYLLVSENDNMHVRRLCGFRLRYGFSRVTEY